MSPISFLPDEILIKIFRAVEDWDADDFRMIVPCVCKRWRRVIFASRGEFFHRVSWTFYPSYPVPNIAACGAWFQRHLASGCITWPLSLSMSDSRDTDRKHPTPQEFAAFLGCLGQNLNSLSLFNSGGIFTSKTFEAFWALTNLTYLALSRHRAYIDMEDFERGMQHLKKLKSFQLSSEEVVENPPVGLAFRGLQSFPKVLCSLTTLETLYLSAQQLRRIPQEISQLTRLNTLEIDGGCGLELRLGHLPSALARLPSLAFLGLHGTLTSLEGPDPGPELPYDAHIDAPGNWQQLAKLKSFSFSPMTCCIGPNCPCLPPEVELMTAVQAIALYGYVRQGEAQEPDLSNLRNLTKLEFYTSVFPKFPAWTAGIPSLHYLRIHGNSEDWQVPEGFAALQNLTVTLSNLREVPDSFGGLTMLTRLELSDCKVAKISPSISKLTRLRDLNLKGNYLYPEVPQELSKLTWLHTLYLRGNMARRTKAVKVHKDGSGNALLPKMAATEGSLRWLLKCPDMQQVFLDVTREERDKLRKFRQEMRNAFHGRPVLSLRLSAPYI